MIFSNVEFYYTLPEFISENNLSIIGDEFNHITKVMRHKVKDEIFVTNGEGLIYRTLIVKISNDKIECEIKEIYKQENIFEKTYFCIPILKNPNRLEFAIEKSIELGITNFLIFDADKSYKKNVNFNRINKISISAMKQSLHSFKPNLIKLESLSDINSSNNIIIFDQNAAKTLKNFVYTDLNKEVIQKNNYYFIFGPEGGLTSQELNLFNQSINLKITDNRLRSETAIVTAASLICSV